MVQSALRRLGALLVAVSFGQCSKSDTLPLITDGDSVRLLSTASCPDGSDASTYDDSGWKTATLPLIGVPASGACMRKEFDIGSSLPDYRWLDIRLTSGSQAQLNVGLGPGKEQMESGPQGLYWTSSLDPDDPSTATTETASTVVEYTLDLRLFPTLLQPKANVLALAIPPMQRALELGAVLRRDDSYDSAYVKVVNGPYSVRPSAAGVQLQWETDRSAPSWVTVSGGARYDGGWSVHHGVDVSMLVPGSFYSFYVSTAESDALPSECQALGVTDDYSNAGDDQLGRYVQRRNDCQQLAAAIKPAVADMHTPAAGGTTLKVAIVGDTRSTSTSTNAILGALAAESPDVIVHTGDLVASGSEANWHGFFTVGAPALLHAPIVPVIGERDVTPLADRFSQLFALDGTTAAARAYSVDLGVVHLALLDSTADAAGQAAWLDADLTAAQAAGAQHLYVVLHRGPWSSGASGGDSAALTNIVPVMRAHNVEAILSGHDNIYEHGVSNGLNYFVTGGAGDTVDTLGAPQPTTVFARAVPHYVILSINGTSSTVIAKDASGTAFDTVALSP
ncbi:MAG TPA: metallophosphoesterase family protein [Polyangia bacterium]|jgi:hypothetical protein|nr:metallophosphoesterase family protein [Polyangia bacterium]